jgi:hypothetical protein
MLLEEETDLKVQALALTWTTTMTMNLPYGQIFSKI